MSIDATERPDTVNEGADIHAVMRELGAAAHDAARVLGRASTEAKNTALKAAAAAIRAEAATLLDANARDLAAADAKGITSALRDRLVLDDARIEAMAQSLDDIAALKDPVGDIMAEWTRPNGLRIARVRVAIGVIGIIYESRPNVTADAGALCLKSGNATILRGGSESFHSNRAIHACLQHGLKLAGLPAACILTVSDILSEEETSEGTYLPLDELERATDRMIEVALEAGTSL